MRQLYVTLLFIFFSISPCLPQKTAGPYIEINKIPKDGLLLNNGWKFHGGDNAEWAKLSFDDGNWATVDPTKDIHYLPEVRNPGIGWFRLTLHTDSSLFNKQLALIVTQVIASEIYLNGRLIYSLGKVNNDYEKESTLRLIDRPFSFKVDDQATQVLAVRYSFNPKNYYLNYLLPNTCLKLRLTTANEGFTDYIIYTRFVTFQDTVQIALYFLLCVMSLFLYFSFRRQVAYLYICFFCLAELVQSALHIPINGASFTCSTISACMFFSYIFAAIGAFFISNAIYKLYDLPKNRSYYICVFYSLLCIPVFIFFYSVSGAFALFFFVVISFLNCRILLEARKNGGSGAGILLISTSTFCVLFFIIIPVYLNGDLRLAFLISVVAVTITLIFLSIFVAGEFARTWRLLQTRVTEVEQLSQKTIAQEQEKQQILTSQKETLETQVAKRTTELKKSLHDLKSAQNQLVQSEKMASLGELTAGIAHEIQNPLNFVNNFSEVSMEMLDEMELELNKINAPEAKAIAADVKQNLEKIKHHGKRADSIVKGMLQHSRAGRRTSEPTDLNKLADEYLRLAYHGLRAKDKSFDTEIETNFDRSLPLINIVAQDIGRVLLNLYNNAFYALQQKEKNEDGNYKSIIKVSTTLNGKFAEITVWDNGTGIPDAIKDKILQPFFTTKPTGEGTGLGLSISYDIIVKEHNGKINVNSKEGEYTAFIISIPI